jgi:hypothetical protein
MQFQSGVAKPVAQLRDLRAIAVIQVLPRAEDLHRVDSRALHLIELRNREPVIHKQVRRQNVLHA